MPYSIGDIGQRWGAYSACAIKDTTLSADRADFSNAAQMDYLQFRALLLDGVDNVRDFQLKSVANTRIYKFEYEIAQHPESSFPSGILRANFDFRGKSAELDFIQCSKRDRASGRHMFANFLKASMQAGMTRLELQASSLVGGYVWARAGVQLNQLNTMCLSARLQARLDVLDGHIDAQTLTSAHNLSRLDQPDALKKVAALPTIVSDGFKYFTRACKANTQAQLSHWQSLQDNHFVANDELPLGRFLLFCENYKGFFDLKNANQLANLNAYTKPKSTPTGYTYQGVTCSMF